LAIGNGRFTERRHIQAVVQSPSWSVMMLGNVCR
jgi:hypothetical protein